MMFNTCGRVDNAEDWESWGFDNDHNVITNSMHTDKYKYYKDKKKLGLNLCKLTNLINTTNMYKMFYRCVNLTGDSVCGNNVINMAQAYADCYNFTGSPVCGDNVINMAQAYADCFNLTGSPVCGPNVTDMSCTYTQCYNLTGSPVCEPNVTSMSSTYSGCYNLTGSPVCGPNVTDMSSTYSSCYNLTGNPVCGPNVTDMSSTYSSCYNLTGNPVCGDKVKTIAYIYRYCNNLTGNPVCGDNVKTMFYAYYGCSKLTGSPVCGPNVTDMSSTYSSCYNLTGNPVCGPNVTSIYNAYFECSMNGDMMIGSKVFNIAYVLFKSSGAINNVYIYSDIINSTTASFGYNHTAAKLNIYVNKNTLSFNSLFNSSIRYNVPAGAGKYVNWYFDICRGEDTDLTPTEWTNDTTNDIYYNTKYNIYVYAVDNVQNIKPYKYNSITMKNED